MAWLPDGFVHPLRVDVGTGHHLRPIREAVSGHLDAERTISSSWR